MSTARRLHYSYEDYLASLALSSLKLEYCDGAIFAMAGGTVAHGQLSAAVIIALGRALPTGCRVATSDVKIRIEASDLSTFPDASVICGEPKTAAIDGNAVVNPTILVEVTSRSTEDYDRGDKLSHYKQLASLEAVIFVSHRTRRITVVERAASDWSERDFRAGERVRVDGSGITFPVDEIYDGIVLDPL
jgi:Uma2 family endonuclease